MANVNVKSLDITHRGAPFVELSSKAGLNVLSMDYGLRGLPYVNNVTYDIVPQSISAKAEIVYTVDNTITSQARAKGKRINIYEPDKSIAIIGRSQWTLRVSTYPFGGTFVASKTTLGRLDIGICKNGYNDLTATVTLKIYTTFSHLPSGNPIYTKVYQPSEIQQFYWLSAYTSFRMQPFYFDDPLPLVVGVEYAWTVEVSADETHPYVLAIGVDTGASGNYRITKVGGTWYSYTTSVIPFISYAINRIVTMARIKSTVNTGWIRDIVTPYSGGGWAMGYAYQCGGVWIATQDKVRAIKAGWYKGANTKSKSYCDIYTTDASHKPTGASLGQAVVDISNVVTGYGKMTDFIFPTDITLSIGTEYCFVIKAPYIHQSGEYFNIEIAANKGNSEGSLYSTNGGSSWTFYTTGSSLWVFEVLRYAPDILISSLARIFNTVQKTTSAKATISSIVTKNLSSKARILKLNTKTIETKARVHTLNTKTIQVKSRVKISNNNKTLSSKARIKILQTKSASIKARIKKLGNDKTIGVKAKISTTKTKTISTKGRIKKTGTNTIGGRARIRNSITTFYKLLQEDGFRILQETADYILLESATGHTEIIIAKGRIKIINLTKTLSVKARVKLNITKTVGAKVKIKFYVTQNIQAKSRMKNVVSKGIQAKSRIKIIGVTKTASSKGRVKVANNTKTVTSKSRIKIGGVNKTISAKARAKNTLVKSEQSKARLKNTLTKTSQAKARIKKVSVAKTTSIKARILNLVTKSIQAKGRMKVSGSNKTITSKSRIKRFGVTQTATAKARIKQQELGRIVGLNKNTNISQGVRVRVPLGLNKITNLKVGTRVKAVKGLNKNTGLLVGQRLDL